MSGSIGTILGGVGGFLVGGPAGAAIGASIGGGVDANRATGKAVDAQVRSASDATAEARRQYDLTRSDQLGLLEQQRADQAPWLDAGKNALAKLMTGTQSGGEFVRPFSMADYQADPGYQFRLDQGQKGIERSAAARGGLLSGAAAKAIAKYNSDTASQEYGNAYQRFNNDQNQGFNRLASLAGVGQTATNNLSQAGQNAYGTIANAGMNTSQQIGNNLTGAGNARASGYIGGANAINNGIGQAFNFYQNNQLMRQLGAGGGGFQSPFGPGVIGSGI